MLFNNILCFNMYKIHENKNQQIINFINIYINKKTTSNIKFTELYNKFIRWKNYYYNAFNINIKDFNNFINTILNKKRISSGMIWLNCEFKYNNIIYNNSFFISQKELFIKKKIMIMKDSKINMLLLGKIIKNIKIITTDDNVQAHFNIDNNNLGINTIIYSDIIYYINKNQNFDFYLDISNISNHVIIEYETFDDPIPEISFFESKDNEIIFYYNNISGYSIKTNINSHVNHVNTVIDNYNKIKNTTLFDELITNNILETDNIIIIKDNSIYNKNNIFNLNINIFDKVKNSDKKYWYIKNIPIFKNNILYYYKIINNKYIPSIQITKPEYIDSIYGNIKCDIEEYNNNIDNKYSNSYTTNNTIIISYNIHFDKIPKYNFFELVNFSCNYYIFKNKFISNEYKILSDSELNNVLNVDNL